MEPFIQISTGFSITSVCLRGWRVMILGGVGKVGLLGVYGKRSRNNKTFGTCRNILSYGPALWRFLETDAIESTNNLAERLIRTIAIWRKTSF